MTVLEYLNLITSEFRKKPKFTAMVEAGVAPLSRIQDLMLSMIPAFDIDTAIGAQLDVLGQWAGVSRAVTVPITGVFFEWDGAASVGWDYGTWQGNQTPGAVTVLPDDAYRSLIRAKIAANRWDGTTEGAYAIWDAVFPTIEILIQDNQDMTYALGFYGGIIDSLTLALVTQGYIPLKPEGVRLVGVFTPYDDGPLFAWDVESTQLQGWDAGSWAYQYLT